MRDFYLLKDVSSVHLALAGELARVFAVENLHGYEDEQRDLLFIGNRLIFIVITCTLRIRTIVIYLISLFFCLGPRIM